MNFFSQLLQSLQHPDLGWEIAWLVAALLCAYGLSAWARSKLSVDADNSSVWFGRRILDGVMFPSLALAFAFCAKLALIAQGLNPALLRIAVPVLLSLAIIRLTARVFTASFPDSAWARLTERLFSWMAWGATILWILGLLPLLLAELEQIQFHVGKRNISLRLAIEAVLSAGFVIVLALWVSAALEKRLLADAVQDLSLRKIAANAIRLLLLVVGSLVALSLVGIDLTALSVMGGALGVGLGFGLQKLAANYVSGFVILAERSLRIGDTVKVDGFEGKVADIKTRYTLIRALSGREAVVPNEKLISERVENLSAADLKVQLNMVLTVGFDADVAQVHDILMKAALACERVQRDPAPASHLNAFGTNGLEFTLSVWLADAQVSQLSVSGEVHEAVLSGLREAHITIPYTQRVVHSA
jgi:small-conductance mechanosensitive channel